MVYAFCMPNEFYDAVKSIVILAIIAALIIIVLISLSFVL